MVQEDRCSIATHSHLSDTNAELPKRAFVDTDYRSDPETEEDLELLMRLLILGACRNTHVHAGGGVLVVVVVVLMPVSLEMVRDPRVENVASLPIPICTARAHLSRRAQASGNLVASPGPGSSSSSPSSSSRLCGGGPQCDGKR
eukprot:scaffold1800_cov387-Prasinococcus_capsulatus_cf.AAC.8